MKKFLRVIAVAMLLLAIAIPCLADETAKCDHHFVVNENASQAATCTTDGYTVYSCDKCYAKSANYTVTVSKTGHKWGEAVTITDPGCGTTGKAVRSCQNDNCTETKTDIIPATGKHTARDVYAGTEQASKSKDPTCAEAGYNALTICKDCGTVLTTEVVPATGAHTYDKVKTVKEPTCTEEGYTLTYCSVCGKEQAGSHKTLKANGHGASTGVIYESKAATCENNQFTYELCSICGAKINEKEANNKLPHNWDKGWVVTTESTCTEKGEYTRTCVACGKVETKEKAAWNHKYNEDKPVIITKATCTENSVGGYICSRCGEIVQSWENKDKLGHKEVITVTPATCEKDGSVVTTCATCKETLKSETLAKLKHVGEWKVTKEACKCTAGVMTEICKNCKAVLDTKEIAATGEGKHEARDEWTIVRQPNAYQEGKAIKTCKYCDVQMAKKYFTNAASLGNAKVDTSKKDTTTSSSSSSSKNNTTSSSSASKNNTAATTSSTAAVKAVVAVEPVVVTEWKLGEKFEIADGVYMTITLNAETNKYDVVVEGVDNIETAKIAFVKADATEAPAEEDYIDLIESNWVINAEDVDEAAILYIVID